MTARGSRAALLPAALLFALLAVRSEPQTPLEQARTDYDAGRYRKAAETLRAAIQQNPRDASLHYWLARSEFELRNYDRAVSSAERAVELEPSRAEYHLWLARAYGRKAEQSFWFSAYSSARKSRREFEEAVRLDPSNLYAQDDLIEFYLRAPGLVGGGDDKALQQIEALAKIDPSHAHMERAYYWREKKRFERADEACRRALAANPRSILTYLDAADYYEKRKDAAGLLEATEGAARIDPDTPELLYYRGVADVLAGGRPDDAEQSLKRYFESVPPRSDRPSHCSARVWLGQLYEQLNRKADAAAEYRTAHDEDPRCKAAHDALRRLQKQ